VHSRASPLFALVDGENLSEALDGEGGFFEIGFSSMRALRKSSSRSDGRSAVLTAQQPCFRALVFTAMGRSDGNIGAQGSERGGQTALSTELGWLKRVDFGLVTELSVPLFRLLLG